MYNTRDENTLVDISNYKFAFRLGDVHKLIRPSLEYRPQKLFTIIIKVDKETMT